MRGILKAMWNTFSVCLACSAERAIEAISLALDRVSHRLKARLNILSLSLSHFCEPYGVASVALMWFCCVLSLALIIVNAVQLEKLVWNAHMLEHMDINNNYYFALWKCFHQ